MFQIGIIGLNVIRRRGLAFAGAGARLFAAVWSSTRGGSV
jgi:hypothetical protein